MTTLLKLEITTYKRLRYLLYLTPLFRCHFLEMAEVKTQAVSRYQTTLLLHMLTQHLTQRVVNDMGSRVVASDRLTTLCIYLCHKRSRRIARHLCQYMHRQTILPFTIYNLQFQISNSEISSIAYFATHLGIERRLIKYNLVERFTLLPTRSSRRGLAY